MKKITIISTVLPILMFVVVAEAQPIGERGRNMNLREQQEVMLQNIEETREGFRNVFGEDDGQGAENREIAEQRRARTLELAEQRQVELTERLSTRRQDLLLRRQEMLQSKTERRVTLEEQRKSRVSNTLSNMINGFTNSTASLDNISARLGVQIDKRIEEGNNVGEAESLLATADSLLHDTLAEVEVVRVELQEALEEEISISYIRELMLGIRESIQATREAFRAVISEINN